jgi:hypothetical protein
MKQLLLKLAEGITKILYRYWLRGTLYHAINDPTKDWDDAMMKACDYVMGYKE